MPVLTKINTNSIADDAVTGAKIPAGAVQASEIAAGGVSGADIGYLGDGSGNLYGSIANQQLHFGSSFTLTDNLTVNDNLTLAKLRDDGTGQSITGDGKTITGTGTLTMGNYIEGRQVGVDVTTRVDELSGALGDNVTGGSGLTALGTIASGIIGSDVTFPAGHIVQVLQATKTNQNSTSTQNWNYKVPNLEVSITPKLNNSHMFIIITSEFYSSSGLFNIGIYRHSTSLGLTYNLSGGTKGMIAFTVAADWKEASVAWLDDSSAMTNRGDKNTITYALSVRSEGGSTSYINRGAGGASQIIVMEIAV